MDILVSNGVVAIGNKYKNLDASQPDMSDGDVFEVNKVGVNDSIIIPAWSVKFVKIPFKCKLGDWKTFEARPYDNVLISNTVFNAKDGFLTLFIIDMNKKGFRRRQELLSFDDTLPYDADEHSFFLIFLIYLHKMIPMTMI